MKSTLDEILERVSILDIVSDYVNMRKSGRNYVGLCPFHKETSPSFTVNIEKQIYYCFGCREGGNVVNFIMKQEQLNFQEALERLAKQHGIPIRRKAGSKKPHLMDALAKLADYYHRSLLSSKTALSYLKERAVDLGTINDFRIGFSNPGAADFTNFLKKTGIPNDIFLATGAVRLKDTTLYDIFRGRVVIPICDVHGQVIAFGGRALEKDAVPKYINSPESSVFTKRSTLFGLDKTRKEIAEKNEAIIVEGYFDLIALYKVGIKNVVSTLGTAITEEHLSKLKNYAENLTLMLDGDEAGLKSILRLIPIVTELDINTNVVILPAGEDPDSYARKVTRNDIDKLLNDKRPALDFFFTHEKKKKSLDTLEGKMSFIRSVMPAIAEIRNDVKKRLYILRLSELTGVEEHFFESELSRRRTEIEPAFPVVVNDAESIIEKKVIGALLNSKELFDLFDEKGGMQYISDNEKRSLLVRLYDEMKEAGELDVKKIITTIENPRALEFVLQADFNVVGYDETDLQKIVNDYLYYMKKKSLRKQAKEITQLLSEAEKRGDQERITELMKWKREVMSLMK